MTNQKKPRAERLSLPPAILGFCDVLRPEESDPPILPPDIRAVVHHWLTEMNAAKELAAVKVKPRRSALLGGPPGCGKTTLAHHLAMRRGLPLLCVHFDRLRSKYLGATGENIARLFEALRGQEEKCLLFMDEFDALASKRSEVRQASDREANAIVDSLLQRVEQFGGYFIAATNRADNIDPAMWRRFGLQIEVPPPGEEERFAIMTRYLEPYRLTDDALDRLVEVTNAATPALLRNLMESVKRDLVLAPRLKRDGGFQATIRRVLAGCAPHPETIQPDLWRDTHGALALLAEIDWPPKLEAA